MYSLVKKLSLRNQLILLAMMSSVSVMSIAYVIFFICEKIQEYQNLSSFLRLVVKFSSECGVISLVFVFVLLFTFFIIIFIKCILFTQILDVQATVCSDSPKNKKFDIFLSCLTLDRKLRLAIKNKDFFIAYQPKFDLTKNKITSYEALLRCNSSRHVFLPKNIVFFAEKTGLILPLGEWIVETVCRDVLTLLDIGALPPNGRVAINLSAKQLNNLDTVGRIIDIVRRSMVNPKNIEFEITETVLMDNIERSIHYLNMLKVFGVTLTIDDFGTGYSSLSYLKRLPIDYLKIDQSFIDGLPSDTNDVAITSAIIVMSHKLGLSVVAEGVENQSQFDFLKSNHCDMAQGYFLGRGDSMNDLVSRFVERV